MSSIEPNPIMSTETLLEEIREAFRRTVATLRRRRTAKPPFVHVTLGHTSFCYRHGLAHDLFNPGANSRFLRRNLRLVHLCSELHQRWLVEHLDIPPLIKGSMSVTARRWYNRPPGTQLVVSKPLRSSEISINFHPSH